MSQRYIDWLRNLTAKSTTIDGTEQVHIDSSGLSQKALLSDVIRYGGGNSTRITTIGIANIHQNSTGAMWLEVTGQTAGNARGAGALDWQAVRTNAARVASGTGAMAIGHENTASGNQSVAISLASVASGAWSAAIGGYILQATGQGAVALGGSRTIAANYAQAVFGIHPTTPGAAQGNIQTFYTATTDASATVLNITGTATDRMVIPSMRACAITGLVTAMSDSADGFKVKAWEIKCVITRDNSNNTRIVGTPIITELGADTEAAGWAITSITADNTNESLAITVAGEAATNIRWQASLFYGQVGF